MEITTCPTCGSRRIRRRVMDLELTVKNKTRIVPQIALDVCPDCGEKLFDHEAMEKMEKVFPPRKKRTPNKRRPA